MKNCISQIIDADGMIWEFEGYFNGEAIFTPADKCKPELLTEENAMEVACMNASIGEKPSIRFLET